MMLRKPTCADCPHNLQYMERLPIKKKGVTMHLGERFCVAGKRARKFKRSDPKTYVPSWCPRLKAPCELRIYGFKNQREWRMHRSMRAYLGEDISQTLDHVAEIVEGKLQEVATRTLEKLREMSPDIANTLSPVIPPASSLKWADVFKSVTISGDESIPINKRGSGSKRLILLNFFRAEVERRKDEANAPGIIYAIEEPETSQHSENQKKLINALIALSTESNVQVIVTTHSAVLVNALDFKNIRLICADGSQKRVEAVRSGQLPFPSLNEVNYLAFSEISEGYHDELYGYLEEQGWLNEYKQGKTTVPYKKISANGTTREQQICMTEYIRHQIHHPENTYNARFNDSQLRRSIEDMRAFVTSKAQTPETT